MVKTKPHFVAVAGEEVENPLLLLGCEESLAPFVAVIGAVASKVIFHQVTQCRDVFMLHLAEERVEAVCRPDGAYRLEVLTRAVAVSSGIDGWPPCAVIGHMLSRDEVQALAVARASIAETQLPQRWHKTKVEGFVNSGNHDANIQKLFLKREINPGFLHYSW